MSQQFTEGALFNALMYGISDEAFLIDATSMQVIAASQSACRRLNLKQAMLPKKSLKTLLGVDEKELTAFVKAHQQQMHSAKTQEFIALDELNVGLIHSKSHQYLLAIKNSLSSTRAKALAETKSRFKALVTNTPGLVFEFQLDAKNEIIFGYLSDGCKALLGIEVDVLQKSPKKFFKIIDKGDRTLLKKRIERSAMELKMLNWEGRIWIEEWQDYKWVNLRSIPRKLSGGQIQWVGIMTNITQSKNEKYELEQSRQRLAELSAHLTHVKEEERSRIAREIHDDLGGNLTVIKIGLASILKRLPADQQILIEKTRNLETIVDNTFEAAHRISGDLRPNMLELGIVAALEWQAKEFEKQMEIPCYFTTNQLEATETEEQAITLFRICQEAMSNIAKYAKAQRVDVALFFNKEQIRMFITDDGIGINAGDMLKPNSFGLRGMAERVAALNGQFSIEKSTDKGTNITVILPMERSAS